MSNRSEKAIDYRIIGLLEKVRVDPQRDRRVGMAQISAYLIDRHVRGDQRGRVAMPKRMESDLPKSGAPQRGVKTAAQHDAAENRQSLRRGNTRSSSPFGHINFQRFSAVASSAGIGTARFPAFVFGG